MRWFDAGKANRDSHWKVSCRRHPHFRLAGQPPPQGLPLIRPATVIDP